MSIDINKTYFFSGKNFQYKKIELIKANILIIFFIFQIGLFL